MFMLTSLINLLSAGAIAFYAILGYTYINEGHGLHPLMCIIAVLMLSIVTHYATVLLTVRATHAYIKAHPKG